MATLIESLQAHRIRLNSQITAHERAIELAKERMAVLYDVIASVDQMLYAEEQRIEAEITIRHNLAEQGRQSDRIEP